jgi:hypothetical protein
MSDPISVGTIGIAVRRILMARPFAKELAKLTGAEHTFAVSERATTRAENVTHLQIDGVIYRIVIERSSS